ncbi:hypothetical protein [Duganella sp. LjRoot269]|uniref:hypothetical protein n=1 Tax=Duganella sp. LjRoot269 TaxID=3342305 RepID=UPI003ED1703B
MAIWQVDLHLIQTADDLPDTANDGWIPPLLAGDKLLQARELLLDYLGPPWQMVDEWFVFGPENGSRVDVVFETPSTAAVVVRFDARNDGIQFPALLCKLAQKLGCLFFSPDTGGLVEPDCETLVAAIDAAHNAAVLRGLKVK